MTAHSDLSHAHFAQVAHAFDMIVQLPALSDDSALPLAARVACLESYYVNLRLLVEFLIRKRDDRDIHRYDFVKWDPPSTPDVKWLTEAWQEASEDVVHLSKRRVPDADTLVSNVHPALLMLLTRAVVDTMGEFVNALEKAQSPWTQDFLAVVESSQRSLDRERKA